MLKLSDFRVSSVGDSFVVALPDGKPERSLTDTAYAALNAQEYQDVSALREAVEAAVRSASETADKEAQQAAWAVTPGQGAEGTPNDDGGHDTSQVVPL